jgi:antitoxin ParD1/3/4
MRISCALCEEALVWVLIMNITLGKEFERRINEKVSDGLYTSASEVIRDGLRLLFEKDAAKNQQLEILREEVAKGFEQLAAGESSNRSVMDIFEQVSLAVDRKSTSKDTNTKL